MLDVSLLPAESPIRSWLGSMPEASVAIWDPRFGRTPDAGGIACLPMPDPNELFFGDEKRWLEFRAIAYAVDERTLRAALDYWDVGIDKASGPIRLVYAGTLGTAATVTPIGQTVLLDRRRVIGRSPGCDLVTRQGPHSDQNVTARKHLIVEPHPEGALVRDLESTNGTYVDGVLATDERIVSPGSELALAGRIRVRVDGVVGSEG